MLSASAASQAQTLEVSLATVSELFSGPAPGIRGLPAGMLATWDDLGAVLGESGVERLLRMAHASPNARLIQIVLKERGDEEQGVAERELSRQLRAWLECRKAANSEQSRTVRRMGMRATLVCLLLLAAALLASWVLQAEVVFGTPGPLRTLLSEALIIAGWVAMWRPLEMMFFDPLRPRMENRLIDRVLATRWEVKTAGTSVPGL